MKNLNEMKVAELKEMAKEMKISNWWNLKKEVLIQKIEEVQNMTEEEKQAIADQKAKEDAAIAEYTKNWKKYTSRYNVLEFIEKWRSGKIVLESEETVVEEEQAPNTLIETPAPEEIIVNVVEDQPEEKSVDDEIKDQPTPKRGALLEFDGKSQNICAWGKELGISPNTLYGRIYKMGWSIERAFTTPGKKNK